MKNFFQNLPERQEEVIQTLVQSGAVKIDRIVSNGQASPAGFWYDQEGDEWVLLTQGTATLVFEQGATNPMKAGDYVLIPAHAKHRVAQVSRDAVWLAVHFG